MPRAEGREGLDAVEMLEVMNPDVGDILMVPLVLQDTRDGVQIADACEETDRGERADDSR